jgi:Undecaprenyl-phosphate galactose phosphotransferase WbaP
LRAGKWRLATIIVGSGKNAREAAQALCSEPLMGVDVLAFVSPPGEAETAQSVSVGPRDIPVVSYREGLEKLFSRSDPAQIVVALDAENLLQHSGLIGELSVHDAELSIIPPLRGLPLYGMEMTHFFSHEVLMLKVRNNLERPVHQLVKRAFDLVVATFLLGVLSPLFAYLIFRIRETGPETIFGHVRIGRDGKPFQCLKFRTMVPNAAEVLADVLASDPQAREEWERNFKLKDDPRITRIGAFLRSTSLDELPQLWNVLRGEMSLVGPRPVIEEELARYGDQVRYYLEARPGITGLWQVSGRNDTGYEDRVALDSWYVRNWSLWYDVVILVRTVAVVLQRKGAY